MSRLIAQYVLLDTSAFTEKFDTPQALIDHIALQAELRNNTANLIVIGFDQRGRLWDFWDGADLDYYIEEGYDHA